MPGDFELQVPQPSITYAFDTNINFYGRSCVACRPPFTFSHICSGKKIEVLVSMFSFSNIYAKVNVTHDLTDDRLLHHCAEICAKSSELTPGR